jgi:hypothetical protein
MLTAANRVKRLKNSKVLVKFSTRGTPPAACASGQLWLSLVAFGYSPDHQRSSDNRPNIPISHGRSRVGPACGARNFISGAFWCGLVALNVVKSPLRYENEKQVTLGNRK